MSRDIVSFGFVEGVATDGGRATVTLQMTTHNEDAVGQVRDEVERAVAGVDGVDSVEVELKVSQPAGRRGAAARAPPPSAPGHRRDPALLPGRRARGGRRLRQGRGRQVDRRREPRGLPGRASATGWGSLDADIYGPSMPMMFGITERPRIEANRVIPFERYGVKVMSLGFILETDTPVIWRGPMVMKALEQLLGDVDWGALDYLIVDLPPGTGDAQLTITQKVPLSGAVVVTTPQDVALIDARKGLAMFRKVNVPVVGIVENMGTFVCPHCGEATDIFKRGGGERTAELLGTPFLGTIPLDPEIVRWGRRGQADRGHEAGRPPRRGVPGDRPGGRRGAEKTAAERPAMSIV